jgi:hypothetical protein
MLLRCAIGEQQIRSTRVQWERTASFRDPSGQIWEIAS